VWKLWQVGTVYYEQAHIVNQAKKKPKAELERAG
jgi:hypothetical protein